MTQNPQPLIMIRPTAQARATFDAVVAKLGWTPQVVYSPIIRIQNLNTDLPPNMITPFVFTSRHAVEIAAQTTDQRGPVICVGQSVAEMAIGVGYNVSNTFEAAEAMIAHGLPNDFTYLHGRQLSVDLTTFGGQSYTLYEQVSVALTSKNITVMTMGGTIPIYSENAAQQLQLELSGTAIKANVICISEKVAKRLDSALFGGITVAQRPTRTAMVDSIAEVM